MNSDLARSGKLMGMPKFRRPKVFPIQSYKVKQKGYSNIMMRRGLIVANANCVRVERCGGSR